MKQALILVLSCIISKVLFCQEIYTRDFDGNNSHKFSIDRSEKKYSLKYNGGSVGEFEFKDASKFRSEISEAVKTKLLGVTGISPASAIDFADKFAHVAAERVLSPTKVNEVLEKLPLTSSYEIKKILTEKSGYLFFVTDKDPEGEKPTNVLSKPGKVYVFMTGDLKTSSYWDSLAGQFPAILQFITKNKDIKVPPVLIYEDSRSQGLRFYQNDTIEDVVIGRSVFATIKGSTKDKQGDVTLYEFKSAKVDSAKDKVQTMEATDEIIGNYDMIVNANNYTLTLNKGKMFSLAVTGQEVKIKRDDKGEPVKDEKGGATYSQGNSVTRQSTGSITSMENNFANFKLLADNVFKKINESTNLNDSFYVKDITHAYSLFQTKLELKEIKDKAAGFNDMVIKGAALDEKSTEEEVIAKTGTLVLRRNTIKVYKKSDDEGKETDIASVKFSIEGAKFSRRLLTVRTKEGTFINRRAPIPVHKINTSNRSRDRLFNQDDWESYIKVGELLELVDGNGYFPDDADNLVLVPKVVPDSVHLTAKANLNSIVNFSLYTDLAGLLGRRPNGLIITDVSGKFITNAGNIVGDITPMAFIEGNITISKFDSKFRSIDSSSIKPANGSGLDTVDRMKLMQTSWLKGNIKFNVFSAKAFTHQYLGVNVGARINVVNADSLFNKEADIIMFEYYPELTYSINRLKNFGMDISMKWLMQRIADREKFANKSWEMLFNPQIAFYYYPFDNPSSTIYIRFNYFANQNKDANNFYQLQFGWRSGLKVAKK